MQQKYSCKANLDENRLYVEIHGSLTDKNFQGYQQEFTKEFDKLKPGMTVLFDMRNCSVFSPEMAATAKQLKESTIRKGLYKSAIVFKSVILKGQMKRIYGDSSKVPDYLTDSVEDGVRYLDS